MNGDTLYYLSSLGNDVLSNAILTNLMADIPTTGIQA